MGKGRQGQLTRLNLFNLFFGELFVFDSFTHIVAPRREEFSIARDRARREAEAMIVSYMKSRSVTLSCGRTPMSADGMSPLGMSLGTLPFSPSASSDHPHWTPGVVFSQGCLPAFSLTVLTVRPVGISGSTCHPHGITHCNKPDHLFQGVFAGFLHCTIFSFPDS